MKCCPQKNQLLRRQIYTCFINKQLYHYHTPFEFSSNKQCHTPIGHFNTAFMGELKRVLFWIQVQRTDGLPVEEESLALFAYSTSHKNIYDFNGYKLFEFEYMLIRSGSRKQMGLEGRKIQNRVTLNFNKNLNRINQNLKLLISAPESIECESFDVKDHPLRRKTIHTASHKFIAYKNKENLNTLNTQKQKRRKASPKLQSKSLKKLINKSDTHTKTYARLPAPNTRRKSKSPSSQKKAKSLSKQKTKHSKSIGRKSFSPQRSYKLEKSQPHKSKPVSAYTSRQTKSSYATTARPVKVPHTDRVGKRKEEESEESPNSLCMLQPIKRRHTKKVFIEGKPMLIDEESISMAKELQRMMEKNIKSTKPVPKQHSKTHKLTSKSKANNKSKKVILSQQTSKQRQFQSKQQPIFHDPQHQVLSHRYRESYQPRQKPNKKRTSSHQKKINLNDQLSMKTQYSVPTLNVIQNLAATKIQKFWRGYQTRKQIQQYKRIMMAVVTIQKFWRGYLARKKYKKLLSNSNMPKQFDQSLLTVKDFNESSGKKEEESSEERKLSEASGSQLSQEKPSRQNIRKMLDSIEQGPTRKLFSSPKQKERDLPLRQRPQMLIQSPTHILETLPNLQKLHKQKLQHFSKLQKQALQRLVEQKLCSPRTLQFKSKEIDERLQYEIERFETGVKEVMRGWNLTNDDGFLTPDSQSKKSLEVQSEENKRAIKAFKNTFDEGTIAPLEDISVELSQYPEEEKSVDIQIMKFDSSLMFMEPYLAALFSFLQSQFEWKEQFLQVMKTPRNISINQLLKNLACVTQQSDDDNNFKLPLYKYLKYDVLHIVSEEMLEDFHKEYKLLVRHTNPAASNLQEIHLRLIVDVLNEELNRQRPTKKLLSFDLLRFTAKVHPSLSNRNLSTQDLLLHNYFAFALEEVFKTASFLCGFIEDSKEIEEGYLSAVNECRMTQMINAEVVREDQENLNFEEEQIEARVSLAEEIFLWLMDEASEDIWTAYV